MITELTNETFNDFIDKADKPVLVDLWASWCGPCKMLSPLVDQLAEKFAGKLTVAKVNVDEASDVAMQFRVSSIPTLLLFKDGELKDTSIGYVPMQQLEAFVSQVL
ncbi:MAG: thioredoxin [Clostridia bacterium]|nr:thioredoxin [Clostridia bacterium]